MCRFKSDVSKDVAGSRQRQALDQKQREAAALRLEAGRKTRDEMMKKVENEAVGTIALALERTFKPMQSMLYKDETELDALAARKQQLAEQDGIADRAARRINTEIKARIERKLDRVLKKKETVLEHSSPKYLNQVHKKVRLFCIIF